MNLNEFKNELKISSQSGEHSVQRGPHNKLLSLLFPEFEAILILCNLEAHLQNFICENFCLPIYIASDSRNIWSRKCCAVQYLLSMPAMILLHSNTPIIFFYCVVVIASLSVVC